MEEADNTSDALNVYCVLGTVPRAVLTLEEPAWDPFSRDEKPKHKEVMQPILQHAIPERSALGKWAGHEHLRSLLSAVSSEGSEALVQEEFIPKMMDQIWP